MIIGNTVLYGATSGRAFFRGLAGERFAVRNSGACAVVEGVGDHGCEYMTGGRVVVLGPTGRNFAAGMSGGIAYVYDEVGDFATRRCNRTSVSFEAIDEADAIELRALVAEHAPAHAARRSRRACSRDWEPSLDRFVKVMPDDYRRVLDEQAGARRRAGRGQLHERSRDALMGELGGFMRIGRAPIPERDALERAGDYREFTAHPAGGRAARPGRALHGLRRAVLPQRLPARQPDPRLERPRLPRPLARTRSASSTSTNNFPEFTGRLCPAPCEAACVLEINEGDAVTIKQIENAIINRAFDEGWVRPPPPEFETGRRVAVVGSGSGGPRRGPAAAPRRTHASSSSSATRRPAAWSASACPTSRSRSGSSSGASSSSLAEGVELRLGVDVGVDIDARELRAQFDAIVLAIGSRVPRDLPVDGPRAARHALRDGVPLRAQPLGGRRSSARRPPRAGAGGQPDQRRRQGRRRDRRRRHRRGLRRPGDARGRAVGACSSSSCPSRRRARPDDRTPWPRWPNKMRLSYAMKEVAGGRPRRARLLGRDDADQRRGPRAGAARRRRPRRRRRSSRRRAPNAADAPIWCCSRWASSTPSTAGIVEQLGAELDARGNVDAPALRDLGRRRVRRRRRAARAVADRLGDQRGAPVRATS